MDEWIPKPQEQGAYEPPRRRPPTAVGVATPEPPRGPRRLIRYRETWMQRIGRIFLHASFATAGGLAAAEWLSIPVMVSSLIVFAGVRFVLERRTVRSLHILHPRSSQRRRAA